MHHQLYYVGIKAQIFNNSRKVLLLKKKSHWDLPGGRINQGELPQDALKRELKEELALQPTNYLIKEPVCSVLLQTQHKVGLVLFTFNVKMLNDDWRPTLSREHLEFCFVDVGDLPRLLPVKRYLIEIVAPVLPLNKK